jgi:Kef-type K+ transport system membrane component KefB
MTLAALVADWAGLHYMVGAFLAGAVIDRDTFDEAQMDLFRNHILLAIMPVYFLSAGLRTQWEAGGAAVIGAAALLLVASVAGKLAGVKLAGLVLGWKKGEASLIGWMLQTKALIMIIFASILLDRGMITNDAFTACLLMAAGSTMLTIPFVTPMMKKRALDP